MSAICPWPGLPPVLSERDGRLYSKLWVSSHDISFARYCAGVLLKKGWHAHPWERRGTIYQQQAAFTTALVTAYGRPFTHSKGWPDLPKRLIKYSEEEKALHQRLLVLRHGVYAHSDSSNYAIQPTGPATRYGRYAIMIQEPSLRLTAEETALFQIMSEKLLRSIWGAMDLLLQKAGLID